MTNEPQTFRYDTSQQWYKGNTHIHSTASDGGKDFAELGDLYSSGGYDFITATDHGVCSDMKSINEASPLLWLDGIEINGEDVTGSYYHVICLGKVSGITPETPFVEAMQIAADCNAMRILAHPFWCGNTLEDTAKWQFDGVEIYNHVCRWLNGKSDGLIHWNAMLESNPDTLGFSADDAHLRVEHPGWNGGWIVVNAEACSEKPLMDAIRRGNYYSSCGPEFHTIESDGSNVHVTTSAVQFVRLVGPASRGQRLGSFDKQEDITEATLPLSTDGAYAYLEIEDQHGRRAWTNTLFRADS